MRACVRLRESIRAAPGLTSLQVDGRYLDADGRVQPRQELIERTRLQTETYKDSTVTAVAISTSATVSDRFAAHLVSASWLSRRR